MLLVSGSKMGGGLEESIEGSLMSLVDATIEEQPAKTKRHTRVKRAIFVDERKVDCMKCIKCIKVILESTPL